MARDFDGTDDIINWGTGGGMGAASNWSMSAWVRPDTSGGTSRTIVAKRSAFSAGNNQFYGTHNTSGHFAIGKDGTSASSSLTITVGSWNHVVSSATNTTVTFHVNGTSASVSTDMRTGTGTTQPLAIGGLTTEAVQFFDGALAEIALWNVVLTTAEQLALSKGFSPILIKPENLVHYFPLIGRNSPEIDLMNSPTGTLTGTSNFPHPRVIQARRRWS